MRCRDSWAGFGKTGSHRRTGTEHTYGAHGTAGKLKHVLLDWKIYGLGKYVTGGLEDRIQQLIPESWHFVTATLAKEYTWIIKTGMINLQHMYEHGESEVKVK